MSKIKNLFATPKKAIITSVCLIAAIAVVGTGTAFAAAAVAEHNSIGATNAEGYALADAGLNRSDVHVFRTEFEREDGQYVYEVKFFDINGVEYEYCIDAKNGTVLKKDMEGQPPAKSEQAEPDKTSNQTVDRPASQPLQTPGQEQPTPASSQTSGQTQSQTQGNSGSAAYIGVDKAKSIAVSHAGMAVSDVVFQKAKLENDDGRAEYEIEFYKNGIEYEYTIDAASGEILEFESEHDDDDYDDN